MVVKWLFVIDKYLLEFIKKRQEKNVRGCCSNVFPGNIYLLKVSNINTRKRCEICSDLTIKTSELRQRRCCIDLVFLLLNLNKLMLAVLIDEFQQVLNNWHLEEACPKVATGSLVIRPNLYIVVV